ncbi:hypothetical protein NADFUDRAFT_49622 [Nadsonia fulvescens var. elongata DSM 6958]|uniref:4'-phosphopantetheinyl transferase domain-containing protein n=1 Tax=Nadsonia fulvescens var. elongata DSM 6958 TaxID=857566 RepID=A0A1E3PQJ1_9ASCO|nr:hypothetical protein NADFUDRAFT_49622 [Nadsonia fulvescens var. elongata DSM 6958]
MATLGHGVDILRNARIRRILASKYCDRFVKRILHPQHELPQFQQMAMQTSKIPSFSEVCNSIDQSSSTVSLLDRKCRLLSSTFAAKEALFKSLDAEDQQTFTFKDWYRVSNSGVAASRVLLNPKYSKINGERFIWSISHDGEYTIGSVIRTELFSQ